MILLLLALLIVVLLAFFLLEQHVKNNSTKHQVLVDKSLKLIHEIDKTYISDYQLILTANTSWALSKLKEHAVRNIVTYQPYRTGYKRLLNNLVIQNNQYQHRIDSHLVLTDLTSHQIMALPHSLIPKVIKLRKALRAPAVRKSMPVKILQQEDKALRFLMVRIHVEHLISKAYRALDVGQYGTAKNWLNEVESTLSNEKAFPDYQVQKASQLRPLKEEIDKALYQPAKQKSIEEQRREEEWDMIFNRKKRLIL